MKLIVLVLTVVALGLVVETKLEPKFAPYIYADMDLVGLKQKYGLKAVTIAFVLAKSSSTCEPTFNGNEAITDQNAVSKIKAFKAAGGDVIMAFGGAEGNYLENACKSVDALAGAYKKVIASTGSTHLDLDIEKGVPTDQVTKAIASVQKSTPGVTFSLTIGADSRGITGQGITILKSAVANGVTVDIVNAMTMDFQSSKNWGGAVQDAIEATHKQIKAIWPSKSDAELYSMIGITPMIGRNDEGKTFTQDDARSVVTYAKSKGIGHIAFWSLGRDNGKCPNEKGSPGDECSGINEQDHEFTKIFSEFDK